MSDYRKEFPGFGEMDVEVPAFLEDCSWRSDACPSFGSEALDVHVFVDHADRERREICGGLAAGRFVVQRLSTLGSFDPPLLITDSWDEVLAFLGALKGAA